MKRRYTIVWLVALSLFLFCHVGYLQAETLAWSVYFSPDGGCTNAIVKELGKAHESVPAAYQKIKLAKSCR